MGPRLCEFLCSGIHGPLGYKGSGKSRVGRRFHRRWMVVSSVPPFPRVVECV